MLFMSFVVALILVSSNAFLTHHKLVFPAPAAARIAIHRHYGSSKLVTSLENQIEILQTQLNLSKAEKERVWNDKEKLWNESQADKGKLWEELKNKQREMDRIKLESFEEIAKFRAILHIRSVIEIMLRNWKPDMSATEASRLLVNEQFLADPKNLESLKLKEEWRDRLQLLEGAGVDFKSIARELKDFFHELSKPVHYPEVTGAKGILLGGNFPLRAAIAMVVLALQRECKENQNIVIKYCNNGNYEPRFDLVRGRIYDLTGKEEGGTEEE